MKKPTARDLAMRDPAYAMLTGDSGADFGIEFGMDDMGIEFGDDYSWGADAQITVPPPTKEQAINAFAQMHARKAITSRRARILEPNKGSDLKVEIYTMGLSQDVALGTSEALDMSQNPDTNFRPARAVANAPAPGFCTLTNIKAANVSAQVGGTLDAFMFAAQAQGTSLSLPTLTPSNRVSVTGNYTGLVPPGYVGAANFTFCLSFVGPASVIA